MRRVVTIISLVLILTNIFLLAKLTGEECFDTVPPLEEDAYYRILTTELIPRDNITTFCVTDSAIVLFYDVQGLVNVYSLEGSFLYGLQVTTLQNGIGDLAVEDECLYIKARGNRMFVFKEQELVRSFLYHEDPTEFRRMEQVMEGKQNHSVNEESYHYLSEANQIVKHTPNGAMISVVTMPEINSNTQLLGILLLLQIAALVHYLRFNHILKNKVS